MTREKNPNGPPLHPPTSPEGEQRPEAPKATTRRRRPKAKPAPPPPDPLPPIQLTGPAGAPVESLDDARWYINRELSLLHFQERVLEEAFDRRNPLLERVKFLGIVASNMDEFIMVRMAGLRQQVAAGLANRTADGLSPAEQLAAVRKRAAELMTSARTYWRETLVKELDTSGIHVLNYDQLKPRQKLSVDKRFHETIFPALTPLAFDPGRPFPHISSLSLNLAVLIRGRNGREHFARIKVPRAFPRLLPVRASSGGVRKDGTVPHHHYFVWLEQVIAAHLSTLFPGMDIIDCYPFHVVRDADVQIQEAEAADLLESIEKGLLARRFGSPVQLMVTRAMPERLKNILVENLGLAPHEVYTMDDPLALNSLTQLHGIDRFDLKDPPLKPVLPQDVIREESMFDAIAHRDILVHHPYDSFDFFLDFLQEAARDPDVLAIKQTLYRVGRNSPVVEALLEARERGKQVAVMVEIKARFDEESNIHWARHLERQGVHVVYGLLGLKTHSKITLVVRKEGEQVRRYVHLSTGNYNHITSNFYTDTSLFTCDDQVGADATDLFNRLTGYSAKRDYHKLLVAPVMMREKFIQLLRREVEHQRAGRGGLIILKTNALVDTGVIQELYRASQAGVKVQLIVRGVCCLRPGVPGLSENIEVRSVVGRFLEHSRIYYFQNGGQESLYMGSADLMPRNLNRRVEVLFPVEDPRLVRHVRTRILEAYLSDNQKARRLRPDGIYERVVPQEGEAEINAQELLASPWMSAVALPFGQDTLGTRSWIA